MNLFNFGGKTKAFYKADNLKDLVIFLKKLKNDEKIFILGAGSNNLITDILVNIPKNNNPSYVKPFISNIFSRIDFIFSSLLTSTPNTSIFLDTYLKFDIFISKQKISEFGKYFTKAAADAPA